MTDEERIDRGLCKLADALPEVQAGGAMIEVFTIGTHDPVVDHGLRILPRADELRSFHAYGTTQQEERFTADLATRFDLGGES